MLAKLIRWLRTAAEMLLTAGLFLVVIGTLALPLAGWGAAYVFAVGLWLLGAAVVPAATLIVTAVGIRLWSGHWYFGGKDPDDLEETHDLNRS